MSYRGAADSAHRGTAESLCRSRRDQERIMVERSKAGAPKITVKDFDDPEARAMHYVDLDLSDSARALIRNGISIDDRTAVESALSDAAATRTTRPCSRRGNQSQRPELLRCRRRGPLPYGGPPLTALQRHGNSDAIGGKADIR
jgi:hypothetical protein